MIDLSNGADWVKIYDRFHVAQVNPSKTGKYYPIPYVLIPTYLDSYTIAVSANTTQFKPTWKLGGRIYPIIEINNSDIGQARSNKFYSISINQPTVLKIQRVSTYYRIIVDVPQWFLDAYIQVWVFNGIEPVDTLEQKVDNIQAQLNRIEQQLDTSSSQ